MLNPQTLSYSVAAQRLPWDARLARRLVAPLVASRVTPNHLTTLRLGVGLGAAGALIPGSYGWSNIGALLWVVSNFLDHTDGELARMSGKTSRSGHLYDLWSDAVVTILAFIAIGVGVAANKIDMLFSPVALGFVAGIAISLIFFLRMRIEEMHGKTATRQASLAGFETEDVLYLFPLATLSNALAPTLMVAAVCAPLYAIWVTIDYQRILRRDRRSTAGIAG
ncbi:MAG: CDP-alcohol phosphatidyltransferase family protein [Pseudomonadota bacterium]|nr:CDP-alcohol phosphatidyltransferase family protein [Pseudomonadota bacterium]